jgi:uncharacterized protein (TIGR03435 family)
MFRVIANLKANICRNKTHTAVSINVFGGIVNRLALICLVFCSSLLGQTTSPPATSAFEVASVKPSASGSDRALVQAVPGRLLMENFAPRTLIVFAFGVADYQVAGGPSWIGSERYDVQAKTEGDATVQQMEGPMLQALLVERFNLAFHRETQQLPVYELIRVSGKAKLQPTQEGSCTIYPVNAPPPSAAAARATTFCGFLRLTQNGTSRALDGKGVSIATLAGNIARSLRRSVIDKTGLTGTYDLHLEWTDAPLNDIPNPETSDRPSIFTAVTEQLGLKLESAKGPVEVIVIDRMERPSQN